MKSLNTYILEGLLNKSNKNIDNVITNYNIINNIVNTKNAENKNGYIWIKSDDDLEYKQSSYIKYKNNELTVIKSFSTGDYIMFSPSLKKQQELLKILPLDFNIKVFNNNGFSDVYLDFNFLKSNTPNMGIIDIDCNDIKKFIPQIFNDTYNIIIFSDAKEFRLKNLQINAKDSIIKFINNTDSFDIFKFQNCILNVKKITFTSTLNSKYNNKYLTYAKNFSDDIINNLSGIKIENTVEILKFELSNKYYNQYYKKNKDIDFQIIDYHKNYLLEALITWYIPQILFLKYKKIPLKTDEIPINEIFEKYKYGPYSELRRAFDLFEKFINLPIVLSSKCCIFNITRYKGSLSATSSLIYYPVLKTIKFML